MKLSLHRRCPQAGETARDRHPALRGDMLGTVRYRKDDAMQIEVTELGPELNRVTLKGRLDATAAEAAELRFTASVGAAGRNALIDMTEVPFVASLGIRMLLACARVLQRKGQRMVIFGAPEPVMEVFETIALGSIIPLAADEAQARALVGT